jgi:transcriptional regulator with XRE-family HTH domain
MQKKSPQQERKAFGATVREWRESRDLSRDALGAKIGVSGATIKQIELGYQNLGKAARENLDRLLAGYRPDSEPSFAECGGRYAADPASPPPDEHLLTAIRAFLDADTQRAVANVASALGITLERAWLAVLREKTTPKQE